MKVTHRRSAGSVAVVAVLTLATGGVLHLAHHASAGDVAWIAGIAVVILAELRPTIRTILHRSLGVDSGFVALAD